LKPSQQKEIPLSNLNITVKIRHLSWLNAICDDHRISYDVENGHFTLILREASLLGGAFEKLMNVLERRSAHTPPKFDLLQKELSTLDLPEKEQNP